MHSAFYYGDTKILNYLFKNLSVKEIEKLLLDESKSEEVPLDFISIDGGKGYNYIVNYLFKKVYKTRELDFTAIRIYTDEFDNYFLGDYLLDSCNFSLFKILLKHSKVKYINYILRSKQARNLYLDFLLNEECFKNFDTSRLDPLKKYWPRLVGKIKKKIEE